MATNLYEVLSLNSSATTEEIRKAYKKKALQTHPDRLPPTASQAEKEAAEEHFRKVNNAYEVLTDREKRKEYDIHGVWPPPEQEEIPRASGSHPQFHSPFDRGFSHPFFSHRHHGEFQSFPFTDPFALFDSIFNDFSPRRSSSFGYPSGPQFFTGDPFERFERLDRQLDREINSFMGFSRSPFSFFGGFPSRGFLPPMNNFPLLPEAPRVSGDRERGGSGYMSQSYLTQTINGVTQTIQKRRDWEGNEHVTRTYPDGREIYTINGVEQPSHGYLTNNPEHRALPAPQWSAPTQPQRLPSGSAVNPPPPYPGPNTGTYPQNNAYNNPAQPVIPLPPTEPQRHHRRHSYLHSHHRNASPADPHSDHRYQDVEDSHHRPRRWW